VNKSESDLKLSLIVVWKKIQ